MPKQTELTTVEIHALAQALLLDLGIVSEQPAPPRILEELKTFGPPRSGRQREVIGVLRLCAAELERRAARPEIAAIKVALSDYAAWLESGNDVRAEIIRTLSAATPLLQAEACLNEHQRSIGMSVRAIPTRPLKEIPAQLAEQLNTHALYVDELAQILDDLHEPRAILGIRFERPSFLMQVTQMLHAGGLKCREIARLIAPKAKGHAWRAVYSATAKRIKNPTPTRVSAIMNLGDGPEAEFIARAAVNAFPNAPFNVVPTGQAPRRRKAGKKRSRQR